MHLLGLPSHTNSLQYIFPRIEEHSVLFERGESIGGGREGEVAGFYKTIFGVVIAIDGGMGGNQHHHVEGVVLHHQQNAQNCTLNHLMSIVLGQI